MRKNELQLSQHNCIQATPSKVGNNKSLAPSNDRKEDIGTAQLSSCKAHRERKIQRKLSPTANLKKHTQPPAQYNFSKIHHYFQAFSSFMFFFFQMNSCLFLLQQPVFYHECDGGHPCLESSNPKLISTNSN